MTAINFNVFSKSNVKCPNKGYYQVFSMNNTMEGELLVSGYTRNTLKMDLPQSLIRIIATYYWNEYIHLVNIYNGDHSRISVHDTGARKKFFPI